MSVASQVAPLGKQLQQRYRTLADDQKEIVIVFFVDKGDARRFVAADARQFISERSISRRLKIKAVESIVDETDFPLEQSYVHAVEQKVIAVRHQLKWFNAVTVIATKRQIETVRTFPFVKEINLVGRWKKDKTAEQVVPGKAPPRLQQPQALYSFDYGPSFTQLSQINVPAVHNLGIYGQGVVICMFDEGVRQQSHEAFSSMNIIAQHDFVDHKESVVPYDPGAGGHGTATLSAIGGFKPGSLIGPAFMADYILARTENDSSETPIEEDNWAKGIEWADSIGVDVTSTSLIYLGFNAPYTGWTWQDMNGNTALITRAADHAVGLGIVVVNAAGNSGYNASHNTLGAPADGDSVITAGAVDASGNRADFSSVGPTVDGRTKPDIMAMGVSDQLASAGGNSSYGAGSGTSFACPLSAGVAALVLCANPHLTPMQVREAMRQTANNASSPNDFYGWGILDALAAVNYYGVSPHVTGVVFEDVNGNGKRDAGDPRMLSVTLRLNGAVAESTLTDVHGTYLFDSLAFGAYTISEDVPAGWTVTSPISNVDSVSVGSSTQSIGRQDFGNFRNGSLQGNVFDDFNGNGVKDAGEHGVAGVRLVLAGSSSGTTTSDGTGNFLFTGIGPGTIAVSESLTSGRVQTSPGSGYSVAMYSGLDTSGLNFGIFTLGTLRGCVFNDANRNGTKDTGESGLASWRVRLTGPVTASGLTNSTGTFVFSNLGPGTYAVSESAQDDWFQTLPASNGSYGITVTSGLDSTGFQFGNNYPPPVGYFVWPDWNLLSLPLTVTDGRLTSLYPSARSSAYIYDGGYKIIDTITNNVGYWLKFSSLDSIPIRGEMRTHDTVHVRRGWNLIGTLSVPVPVASLIQIPDSNVWFWYSYHHGGGYVVAGPPDTLFPNRGYWVRARSNGEIVLDASLLRMRPSNGFSTKTTLVSFNTLTITDRDGKQQVLHFGNRVYVGDDLSMYDLPPKPPVDAFDVRFSSGSPVWVPPGDSMGAATSIDVQGAGFPLTASWEIRENGCSYALTAALSDGHRGQSIQVSGNGSTTITDSRVKTFILQKDAVPVAEQIVPETYELEQNYPNPFNPTTNFGLRIADFGFVSLKVYDVLGREVAALVNEVKQPGVYSVTWDASSSGLPSGLYYYRMEATSISKPGTPFTMVRKFLLLK